MPLHKDLTGDDLHEPGEHEHDAADITTGVLAIARLATGTPDGTKFVRDDGTLATPASSGGAVTLITETPVGGGGVASVSFSSIAATWRDLRVVVRGRGDKAATSCTIRLRFNADSGSNYDTEALGVTNTTVSGTPSIGATSLTIGFLPAASATANFGGRCEATISDYRGTTFQKQIQSVAGSKTSNAAASVYTETRTGWWRSTSAITDIEVTPDTGNFIAGTVVSLYGCM